MMGDETRVLYNNKTGFRHSLRLLKRVARSRWLNRLTIFLLILTSLILVPAMFFPILGNYISWAFVAIHVHLVICLLLCGFTRVLSLFEKRDRDIHKEIRDLSKIHHVYNRHINKGMVETEEAVLKRLNDSGFRCSRQEVDGTISIHGLRGRIGPWGSMAFHMSLILLLPGAILNQAAGLNGLLIITEGQEMEVREASYNKLRKGALFQEKDDIFRVRLESVYPEYQEGDLIKRDASEVTVIEGGLPVKKHVIHVNNPLRYRGYRFYQEIHGFSPLIVVREEGGRQVFGAYVGLDTYLEDEVSYRGGFDIESEGIRVEAEVFPDMVVEDGVIKTASPFPKNPSLDIVMRKSSDVLFQGHLLKGEGIELGDLILSFEDLRYWTALQVEYSPGSVVILIAFWVGVCGALIAAWFIPRDVRVFLEETDGGTSIRIAGKSSRYNHLFQEEVEALGEEISTKL